MRASDPGASDDAAVNVRMLDVGTVDVGSLEENVLPESTGRFRAHEWFPSVTDAGSIPSVWVSRTF
jgi:hypothetical protein